jgi:hypothetical protein
MFSKTSKYEAEVDDSVVSLISSSIENIETQISLTPFTQRTHAMKQ